MVPPLLAGHGADDGFHTRKLLSVQLRLAQSSQRGGAREQAENLRKRPHPLEAAELVSEILERELVSA